jgi:hypothetical protein
MEEEKRHIENHFEAGSNCQVFNGNITGCTFAMPGSTVTQQAAQPAAQPTESHVDTPLPAARPRDEKLSFLVHPSVPAEQEWQIHDEIKNLVARQSIPDICRYMKEMATEKKILLPQMASAAYAELVRMGMPDGEGYSEKYFTKLYNR